ncbi:MAG TPA: hypothetical protein VF857_02505 [Spirochaetota bacterium]
MADSKVVVKLDQRLIAEKVIDRAYADDYQTVHRMLNALIKKSGGRLTEKTFEKGEAKLRAWLISLCKKGASQEKLTSYLRCGLAHLSFDFIESSYKSIDVDDLISRTLVSFKKRDFHKTYFKAPDFPKTKKRPLKKNPKKAAKKKSVAKKKIKAVKKRIIIKRTTKKKSLIKKKPKSIKRSAKRTKGKGKKARPKALTKVRIIRRRSSGGFLDKLFG